MTIGYFDAKISGLSSTCFLVFEAWTDRVCAALFEPSIARVVSPLGLVSDEERLPCPTINHATANRAVRSFQ